MRDLRRPLIVFGTLLCVPAAVLASLGWRSLSREHASRRADAARTAQATAERVALEEADALERLRRAEDARPYYHYAAEFQPAEIATNAAAFVPSPLSRGSDDPRHLGWFQRALFASDRVSPLEGFGPAGERLAAAVEATYGAVLTRRLREAAAVGSLPGARVVPTPLAAVAADEEKGQLLEEIHVATRKGEPSTQRLDDYRKRVQGAAVDEHATVDVRATPFSYLARPAGAAGPPLVAWRLVWIPGREAWRSRDAPSDRWLLQGYALDPGRTIPTSWTAAGEDVLVCRGDCGAPPGPPTGVRAATRSLAEVLRAEVVEPSPPPLLAPTVGYAAQAAQAAPSLPSAREAKDGDAGGVAPGPAAPDAPEVQAERIAGVPAPALGSRPLVPDPSLAVVAVPAHGEIESSFAAARNRFLLLVLGLAAVVGVGFATLLRSVRREVALARRKEDFVAAVTHELKTPLAGIRMYADMLRSGFFEDPEAAGSYAGRIVGEAKRLDALVDRVLSLAAWDRGVAAFRPVPGDLAAVAREAVAAADERARADGTSLRLDAEPGLPLVPFDPALALPLLSNLVDNAVKYSARSETREVVVRVHRSGPAHVAVSVSDRGPGIPAGDRERVFEPFFRSGREETRSAPGVGLGLALVRRYAEAHGAEVSLESAEGRGTTVTVRFPASA